MSAPRIRRYNNSHPAACQGQVLFEVVAPGKFGGREWRVGELAVCADGAWDGDRVVLVPMGMGRARFGALDGDRLQGDRGESCSRARWHVAGRLLAAVRSARVGERNVGWVLESLQNSNRPLALAA
jgi:hypothetical protein